MISGLIGLFVVAVVVRWAIIKLSKIISWFRARRKLTQEDKDIISFTIKEQMEQGNYVVYQGIYNEETEELLDGQKIIAGELESEFEELHEEQPLVVYQ